MMTDDPGPLLRLIDAGAADAGQWIGDALLALEQCRAAVHCMPALPLADVTRLRLVEELVALDEGLFELAAKLRRMGRILARDLEQGARVVDVTTARAIRGRSITTLAAGDASAAIATGDAEEQAK